MGAMNRMKEMTDLYSAAAWRLAAAYALVKQIDVAKQIISRKLPELKSYYWFNSTFGSSERDIAMQLETLSLLNDKAQAFTYMKKVAASLSSSYWLSTQTTAYSLLSLSKFLESEKTSRQIKFTYTGGGKTNVNVDTHIPVIQIKLDARQPGSGNVNISNTGGLLFVRVVTEGIPETGPQNKIENNLKMDVSFKNTDGKLMSTYRKIHIPQDPLFYEKNYFEESDGGYKIYKTKYGTFAVLICYDQWFPEAARINALKGAEIIFYPTAIGYIEGYNSSDGDWHDAWRTVQRAHAIVNGVHVAAVNRVGKECQLNFWGGSFVCDSFGKVLGEANNSKEETLVVKVDLSKNKKIQEK